VPAAAMTVPAVAQIGIRPTPPRVVVIVVTTPIHLPARLCTLHCRLIGFRGQSVSALGFLLRVDQRPDGGLVHTALAQGLLLCGVHLQPRPGGAHTPDDLRTARTLP